MTVESTDRGRPTVDVAASRPLSTPRLVLYSKSAAIPYLNYNFVRQNAGVLFRDEAEDANAPELLTVGVADLLDLSSSEALSQLSKLPYLANYSLMITLYDPLIAAYQDLKSTVEAIPVSTLHGKRMVTVPQLLSITRQSGAMHMQSLADINTPPTAGKKWTAKATNRSVKFLEDTLAEMDGKEDNTSSTVKLEDAKRIKLNGGESRKSNIWATVTGGYSVRDRLECCRAITANADRLYGVVLDGFFGYQTTRATDPLEAADSLQSIAPLLRQHILPALPTKLPRYLTGALLPDDICRAIHLGIDLVDSSIATLLTARGCALPSPLIDLTTVQLRFSRQSSSPSAVINLADEQFTRANIPLSAQCGCHTCANSYSRAYINHLLRRNELNGSMLLQMHNHYALTQFMAHLRRLIAAGQFQTLLVNSGLITEGPVEEESTEAAVQNDANPKSLSTEL